MAITTDAQAVIAEHSFVVYTLAVTACGGSLIRVPALHYGADLDAMLDAVTERTAMVFLANPNNPTGTWVGEDALVRFLDRLPDHVWMVLDEAYFEYVEADNYPDGIRLLERYPNLIVTRTFSKIYGLAALRVGYAVSSPEVADLLNRARQPFNVNALALAGAEAALEDSAYVQQSRRLNASGMAQVTQGLTAMGLTPVLSQGNFLAFAVPESTTGVDVYNALLREGVIVRTIAEYGLPGHLRVTIGLPEENARFLEALARVLD
jgi:histidinol-phosphate aminotransferase